MGSPGETEKMGTRKEKEEMENLGFNVADLVGEEGLDAGALGEALQLPQLVELQPQLLRRHLRSALGSSWPSRSVWRLFGAV